MRCFVAVLIALWIGTSSSAARAEDLAVYEVEGEADAGVSDPRVVALDDAFARAISQALSDVIDAETRKANKAALTENILGRARLWIARFSVTKDETVDGRRQLTVAVRVDRDKMRARLGELNITTTSSGEQPKPGAKAVVILLRTADGKGARASYGAGAEKDVPGLGALAAQLRGAGMAIKRAPASGPAARVRADGELPLEDDEAAALAADAKADVAAVAGVSVGEPMLPHGVAAPAVLVTAQVRLIAGRKPIGQGAAQVAARGTEPAVIAAAIERALVAATSDVVPPAPRELAKGQGYTGDDAPVAEPGVVLVRLAPKTPWGLVAAEQKWLSGAKGISRAVLRRASPGGWVIGVTTTESVERIAQIARKPPATGASAKVKVVGDLVEVALAGAP
ncbi:MAG TPA: hypothetical protein VN253_24430 [Kofleriaceae bacterium]|nr:hypothetical protein [Kofleriaceae bacterium]